MRDLWLKNCVCFVIPLSLLIAKGEVHSCRRLLCLACNLSLGSTGKNCSQDFYFFFFYYEIRISIFVFSLLIFCSAGKWSNEWLRRAVLGDSLNNSYSGIFPYYPSITEPHGCLACIQKYTNSSVSETTDAATTTYEFVQSLTKAASLDECGIGTNAALTFFIRSHLCHIEGLFFWNVPSLCPPPPDWFTKQNM